MIAAVKAAFHDNLAPQIARVVIPQLQQALRNELKNLVREVAGEDDREAKRLKTTVAGAETIRPPEERCVLLAPLTHTSGRDILPSFGDRSNDQGHRRLKRKLPWLFAGVCI